MVFLARSVASAPQSDSAAGSVALQIMVFGGEGLLEGHRDAVPSVSATATTLFTCSLDGSAKAWCTTGLSEGG